MNRTVGILAMALAMAVAGGTTFACDPDGCAAKSADCSAAKADCAAKAEKVSGPAGHDCPMKPEQCTEAMRKDAQTHGWLGISLDMDPEGHMTISRVWTGSPAEKAGFKIGDQVKSINGTEVSEENTDKIFSLMQEAKIGDRVTFAVARGSEGLKLEATLSKIPDEVLAEGIERHLREHHNIAKN